MRMKKYLLDEINLEDIVKQLKQEIQEMKKE